MRRSQPVKVKVCGITQRKDAIKAFENGADALGFIFYKNSPRYVKPAVVKEIVRDLPPFLSRVGVFVNEDIDTILNLSARLKLDIVQLHGDESPAFCRKIKSRVFRALRIKNSSSLIDAERYHVDALLLDTFNEKQLGGTGETFDWNLAKRAKRFGRIILAGGLNPENVSQAIEKVRPYGVDVCSGVEKKPGEKDLKKLREFLQNAKAQY